MMPKETGQTQRYAYRTKSLIEWTVLFERYVEDAESSGKRAFSRKLTDGAMNIYRGTDVSPEEVMWILLDLLCKVIRASSGEGGEKTFEPSDIIVEIDKRARKMDSLAKRIGGALAKTPEHLRDGKMLGQGLGGKKSLEGHVFMVPAVAACKKDVALLEEVSNKHLGLLKVLEALGVLEKRLCITLDC